MQDFFAFSSTYITDYWPFSAYFRVVATESISEIDSLDLLDKEVAQRFINVIIGAAIAEQSARMRLQKSLKYSSNITSLRSSLSFVLGSATIFGYRGSALLSLAKDWAGLFSNQSTDFDRIRAFEIAEIWQALATAISSRPLTDSGKQSRPIQAFLFEAMMEGRVSGKNLSKLNSKLSLTVDLSSTLLASRETRIKRLNDHISMMDGSHDKLVGPFIAGLLLAIAGNGAFEMLQSSDRLLERSPQGVIWFGICASLFQESNVLTYSNCLGRRLARDIEIEANIFSPLICDCNIQEFHLLKNDPGALSRLVAEVGEQPSIEMVPGVITQAFVNGGKVSENSREALDVLNDSVREMQFVIERTHRRMARMDGPSQRELFKVEERPRGRKR